MNYTCIYIYKFLLKGVLGEVLFSALKRRVVEVGRGRGGGGGRIMYV